MRIRWQPHSIPFATFTEKILQYANDTFSVLHHKFLKQIWGDNRITAKLHHNQCTTNWQKGVYEIYIPTRDSIHNNLEYYRIAIKIQPYNSNQTKKQEAKEMMRLMQQPLGVVESELIILVAPRQDRWGLVRGFKHLNARGHFTAVITNRSPEICWKRIIDHIHNFLTKRADGLMRSLGFETWLWKWMLHKNQIRSIITILKHFSFSIQQSAETFFKLISHLRDKMKVILEEIGVQNVALSKTTREIREEISILKKALVKKVEQEVRMDVLRVVGMIPNG